MGDPPSSWSPVKHPSNNPYPSRVAARSYTLTSPSYQNGDNNNAAGAADTPTRSMGRPGAMSSNRHSMALREGFNPASFSFDTEIINYRENENYDTKPPSREDRNNNRLNRNNIRNNLPSLITSSQEFQQQNASPSHYSATPLSPFVLSPPITPTQSPNYTPMQSPNRLTPTPLSPSSPFTALSPTLSPLPHHAPNAPFSNVHAPSHSVVTTMGNLITTDTKLENNNDHAAVRVGKGMLSSRSATTSFIASRSEGNIDLYQQAPASNLWGSGGVPKEILQNFRANNVLLRPSNSLNNSTGISTNPTNTNNHNNSSGSTSLSSTSNNNYSTKSRKESNNTEAKKERVISISSDEVFKFTPGQPTRNASTSFSRASPRPTSPNSMSASPKSVMHSIETSFAYVQFI